MSEQRSEQEVVRREKLGRLREKGYPFPNDVLVDSHSEAIKEYAQREETTGPQAPQRCIAGRIVSQRLMGKAAFCHIQDTRGRIQVYVRKDDLGAGEFENFQTLDLGDIVEVRGYPFVTKTGEPSLHAQSLRLLVKCLHPLPEKWHGLTDVERRYRQRYLDLIVNPEVRETFLLRAKIISHMRKFFEAHDFIEVETPVLNTIASGAAARPFITHHNTLDLDLHLRIALELPLKRLVVGGIDRVFEIGRVFRNEGISTQHNPEFTMVEFYQAYATYETLMDFTEKLFIHICDTALGKRSVEFGGNTIDFTPPWKRTTMVDAVYEYTDIPRSCDLTTLAGVHEAAKKLGVSQAEQVTDAGLGLYLIFDEKVEERILQPTFITQHPLSISPLARPNVDDPRFTDRFELMIAGMELANAFSELNDSEDQLARMQAQLAAKNAGDEEAMALDEDFVQALEYGMPPTAGEGIGIDRLVMLLTSSESIRDVILFPTMRPQHD